MGFRALWVGVGILGFVGTLGLASSNVQAAPSLILLEDNGGTNPYYRNVMESLGALIVANNLGRYYDHIDVLTGDRATREALFAQIKKREAKGVVDLVILTHGAPKRLNLGAGDISDSDVRAAGPFQRLRMVYMMACYGASMVDAWRAAGAQVAIGHQEINSLPGFFFPRFLKRWAQGRSARDAIDEAYRFAEGTAELLSSFIVEKTLLNHTGVLRSEPVMGGVDIDRNGHLFPGKNLTIEPLTSRKGVFLTSSLTRVPQDLLLGSFIGYPHTSFEQAAIGLLGGMIPQAQLDSDAIPSAQALVDQVKGVAWAQLIDSFPGAGGLSDLPLPSDDGEEVWVDGEGLRYLLESLRDYAGEKMSTVLDRALGIRLTRMHDSLMVGVYFDRSFSIDLRDRTATPNWQPYRIEVPHAVRFAIRMQDGILKVSGLDAEPDALILKIKMPLLPESIWVRRLTAHLESGDLQIEAGVMGDRVSVMADGQMTTGIKGIDIWATIERNLELIGLPWLAFRPL
ncbi:hypothetical protein WDW37_10665 [Bdellovibrionota bacterium FG-1]